MAKTGYVVTQALQPIFEPNHGRITQITDGLPSLSHLFFKSQKDMLNSFLRAARSIFYMPSGRIPLPQRGGYLFNCVGTTASTNCA